MGCKNQIGPQLGFDPEGQIGVPMIEKTRDPMGHIGRHELMTGTGRQPLFEKVSRCNRSGRDQNRQFRLQGQQAFNKSQYGGCLTNAGGMYPALAGAELLVRTEDVDEASRALRGEAERP